MPMLMVISMYDDHRTGRAICYSYYFNINDYLYFFLKVMNLLRVIRSQSNVGKILYHSEGGKCHRRIFKIENMYSVNFCMNEYYRNH